VCWSPGSQSEGPSSIPGQSGICGGQSGITTGFSAVFRVVPCPYTAGVA